MFPYLWFPLLSDELNLPQQIHKYLQGFFYISLFQVLG